MRFSGWILCVFIFVSGFVLAGCDDNIGRIEQYQKSWEHQALSLQRGLDLSSPFSQALFVGTHNSYNALPYQTLVRYSDPNQELALYEQLEIDIRAIELDLHWYFSMSGAPWNWRNRLLLSHAQGNHLGASAFDRPVEEGFEEIRSWLNEPKNKNEFLVIYIEQHIDGRFAEAIELIGRYFGDIIYRPQGSGCQGVPMDIRKIDVLNAGKRLLIVSEGCDSVASSPEWGRWVFIGVGDSHGSVYRTGDNDTFQPYPACASDGISRWDYDNYWVRFYEDRTFITATFGDPDRTIEAADVREFIRCGVNILGMDKIIPEDGRLQSAVWSWAPGEPNNYNNNENCAMQYENGRFNDAAATSSFRFACKNPATGAWYVTSTSGAWSQGLDACPAETGGAYRFAVPWNGYDNEKLIEAKRAAGAANVWLNYYTPDQGTQPLCRQVCSGSACTTVCASPVERRWLAGLGSEYFTPPNRLAASVHQHCDFGGYGVSLAVGDYALADLQARGIRNDDLSSLRVPAGLKVTLFEHADFSGAQWDFTADTSCLVGPGCNDKASSIRVSYAQTAPRAIGNLDSVGYYRITAKHSGLALDVSGVSTDAGAVIHQWGWHGGDNQRWFLEPAGEGYYRIAAKHSGLCMDIAGASTGDGAGLIQWTCHAGENQKFRFDAAGDGSYFIVPKHSGKYLDIAGAGTGNGAKAIQWSPHGGNNQRFIFEKVE